MEQEADRRCDGHRPEPDQQIQGERPCHAEAAAHTRLDLRGTACPMNWVKLKLELEEMAPGQVIEVWLDDGDAIRNVPRSAMAEGNAILEVTPIEGGFRLLIERAEANPGELSSTRPGA